MDARAQAIFRAYKAQPSDEELREQALAYARRYFTEPEVRFQGALREGGALERALVWEMEFSRVSVKALPQGGLISCGFLYGNIDTHIRIWYPTMDDILRDFHTDDVRIVVSASPRRFSDVVETLEGYFPGATIVSAVAAREVRERGAYGSWPKPQRRDHIDQKALAGAEALHGSTRGQGWGNNPWVG